MDPITIMALSAGVGGLGGLIKGLLAKDNEEKERRIVAEMWRTSPWTKLQPGQVERANVFGDVIGGLGYGGMVGSAWHKLTAPNSSSNGG